ncbi:hypothetical protein RF11_09763 [Thelohanellus kitauei]|uniref:Uncharacterized protein n=1 Tax=Thelohanellus kitauei TaxID=669202 RepID=A0A0C2MZ82_THEKT|nr:hypothetical protein RF11_09763 [Thelohanellus kitauei]
MGYNEGKSQRETGRTFGIPQSTTRSISKKFEQHGDIEAQRRCSQKLPGLTPEMTERIRSLIEDNNLYIINQRIQITGVDVNPYTMKIIRTITEMRNDPEVKKEGKLFAEWYKKDFPIKEYIGIYSYIDQDSNLTTIWAINGINFVKSEAVVGSVVDHTVYQKFLAKLKGLLGQEENSVRWDCAIEGMDNLIRRTSDACLNTDVTNLPKLIFSQVKKYKLSIYHSLGTTEQTFPAESSHGGHVNEDLLMKTKNLEINGIIKCPFTFSWHYNTVKLLFTNLEVQPKGTVCIGPAWSLTIRELEN